jgi:hypothetical protein
MESWAGARQAFEKALELGYAEAGEALEAMRRAQATEIFGWR